MFSISAAAALLLAFISHQVSSKSKTKRIMSASTEPFSPKLVEASTAFSQEEFSILKEVHQADPQGNFLQTRHGVTHFVVDRDESKDAGRNGVVVMALGIGNNVRRYRELSTAIASEGFVVVSYDFYGHGFSKATDSSGSNNLWIEYSPEILVDQLEDVTDFVCGEEKKELVGMIGHSTGGLAVISANLRWGDATSNRKVIPKLALVAPALFANKPLVARIGDLIPTVLTTLMKCVPRARVLIGDAYSEAGEKAFAKDPDTGNYIYESKFKKNAEEEDRFFGRVDGVRQHPFLAPAILGINNYTLRKDLLPAYCDVLRTILGRDGEAKSNILFVWGSLDVTVPIKENKASIQLVAEENSNLELEVVDRLGHEAITENASIVAESIIPFLKK